jgi:hypothetical protein
VSTRQLVFEDFADKVGEAFSINEPDMPALSLTEAQFLKSPGLPGVRPPFSLIFVGATHACCRSGSIGSSTGSWVI